MTTGIQKNANTIETQMAVDQTWQHVIIVDAVLTEQSSNIPVLESPIGRKTAGHTYIYIYIYDL